MVENQQEKYFNQKNGNHTYWPRENNNWGLIANETETGSFLAIHGMISNASFNKNQLNSNLILNYNFFFIYAREPHEKTFLVMIRYTQVSQ